MEKNQTTEKLDPVTLVAVGMGFIHNAVEQVNEDIRPSKILWKLRFKKEVQNGNRIRR
ncbi:hypothetical protein LCGC14_2404500 [marine sediment metagenome]|uniref:Uncharacterized protein n=1 Tax=marine sediment metagenome TaxID=412755 RepID=A0A0F9CGE3_9ZZZZ